MGVEGAGQRLRDRGNKVSAATSSVLQRRDIHASKIYSDCLTSRVARCQNDRQRLQVSVDPRTTARTPPPGGEAGVETGSSTDDQGRELDEQLTHGGYLSSLFNLTSLY